MKKLLFVATSLLALSACSTLPPADQMARLPVVDWGQPAPKTAFILHIPAGQPVTAQAVIDGDLFSKTDRKTLTVALARDIYLYRDYASRDGKNWKKASDLVNGNFTVRLPSTEHPLPALIAVSLNDRKKQ